MTEKKNLPRAFMTEKETKFYNSKICDLVSIFLNIAPDYIDMDMVTEISESCGVSREYAYAQALAAICGIDAVGEDRKFFKNYFIPMINELDVKDFTKNPYYRNIVIPDTEKENWTLKHMTLSPGEGFVCDDFLVTDDGRMIPQLGFFTEPYTYPAVLENDREWMTLMPNETVTTAPAVEAASGRVLTFGLGLGYFAYMASQKQEVESVTVVELDKGVISLFETFILPQFANKDKVKVICSDVFSFADNVMKDDDYDFVFADIWHDAGDGRDLYLRMKEYEKKFPSTRFSYWLEDTIKCYLDKELWP